MKSGQIVKPCEHLVACNYHACHLRHLTREMAGAKQAEVESPGGHAHMVDRLLPSPTVAYRLLSNSGKGVNMNNASDTPHMLHRIVIAPSQLDGCVYGYAS